MSSLMSKGAGQAEQGRTIALSGRGLLSLIDSLMNLSELEEGNIKTEEKSLNLIECIEDVLILQGFRSAKRRSNFFVIFHMTFPST